MLTLEHCYDAQVACICTWKAHKGRKNSRGKYEPRKRFFGEGKRLFRGRET